MCEIIEKLQKESALENSMEIALKLLKADQTVTFASSITDLPVETVKQLAIDNNIAYNI